MANTAENFINYVRNSIDLTVADEDGYPVPSSVLVKSGIATRPQLAILEYQGLLKSVEFDIPSILVPGSTVKEQAYYTERIVPKVVADMHKRVIVE